jgi:hypothetical protein
LHPHRIEVRRIDRAVGNGQPEKLGSRRDRRRRRGDRFGFLLDFRRRRLRDAQAFVSGQKSLAQWHCLIARTREGYVDLPARNIALRPRGFRIHTEAA